MPGNILPVEREGVFIEIQEHTYTVSFLEEVVLATKGVEKGTSRAQLLGCATCQSPRPVTYRTRLDSNNPVRSTGKDLRY